MFIKKRMFLKIAGIICLFVALGFSQRLDAQQGTRVSGSIVDKNKEPLPGVNVVVRGTTTGVISDENGEYSVNVTTGDSATLVFSLLGFTPQAVKVGNRRIITVTMESEASELEEVTVVAFAKQKKESVIASISTVNTRELKVP